jgi:hypothetical protein
MGMPFFTVVTTLEIGRSTQNKFKNEKADQKANDNGQGRNN